jgi:hypothetical protein
MLDRIKVSRWLLAAVLVAGVAVGQAAAGALCDGAKHPIIILPGAGATKQLLKNRCIGVCSRCEVQDACMCASGGGVGIGCTVDPAHPNWHVSR